MSAPTRKSPILVLVTLLLAAATLAHSGRAGKKPAGRGRTSLPSLAEKTKGTTARDGFLRFHVDTLHGKIWLEVPPARDPQGVAAEMLYVEGLTTGLGSNPIGLDRSQLGPTRWVVLRRVGPRVLLEQRNPMYRARSEDPSERRATSESFATSILWGHDIAALDADGRSLVDFTSFLIRDAHQVEVRLAEANQGSFRLDKARSIVELEECLAFPDNVELEVVLTYAGTNPGGHVRQTVPSPDSVTLVQHHSFIRLPDDGYRPRRFDPRAGSYAMTFRDYAAAMDEPIEQRWISRHRLQKVDPGAERSRVVDPIVFYVDRGVPQPVRSALIDGASWWADAFERAGFIDAFRVELLPEGAHPLDARYNVIQWVHRSTRGWSYGGGVIDPRTGEILKGHVLLGSLRVRQDRLLFEGLAGTEKTGSGAPDDPLELALARIRQLSAHEVGHALGLDHNFAASTYGGRASVMDYPAPLVRIDEQDELDFSNAYGVGVGSWDLHSIRYAYSEFPPELDEEAALDAIVRAGLDAGLLMLADKDARPAWTSDPRANLWDNGDDPVESLALTLQVRRHALDRFGVGNVRPGTPLAHLQEVLAPVYFHHRYQLDAAVKVIGGMEFHYAHRGDGLPPTRIVEPERQRKALQAVLGLLDPRELDLPDSILALLAPRPFGEPPNREMFANEIAPAFDLQGAAATAAAAVIDGLLQPQRLGRLAEFKRRDPSMPGVAEVLDSLVSRVFGEAAYSPRHAELSRLVQSVLVERLIRTARADALRPTLRAHLEGGLKRIRRSLTASANRDSGSAVHAESLTDDISRFLERSDETVIDGWTPPNAPPGSPIGAMGCGSDYTGY